MACVFKRGHVLSAVAALAAGVVMTGPASAQVPNLPGWDLVFNDEFDGTSLNTTHWTALNRRDSFNNGSARTPATSPARSAGRCVPRTGPGRTDYWM